MGQWRSAVGLIAVCWLAACSGRANPGSTPTAAATVEATAPPTDTAIPAPTDSAEATASPSAASQPLFLFNAPRFSLPPEPWSPGDRWIMFWAWDAEDLAADPNAPGTLTFIDSQTGQPCSARPDAPYSPYSAGSPAVWLPDGSVLLITGGRVLEAQPCEVAATDITGQFPATPTSIAAANDDGSIVALQTARGMLLYRPVERSVRVVAGFEMTAYPGYSWSPNGALLAVSGESYSAASQGSQPGEAMALTQIIDVASAAVIDTLRWSYFEAKGDFGGPIWLSSELFVISQTADRGPLLLTVSGKEVNVARELFGQDYVCPDECFDLRATGSPRPDGSYVIALLHGDQIDLYHSASGEVETLQPYSGASFSPDGAWMVVYSATSDQHWLRPVERSDTLYDLGFNLFSGPAWAHDSSQLATGSSRNVFLHSAAPLAITHSWDSPRFPRAARWSRQDDRILLLTQWGDSGTDLALYLLSTAD